MTIETVAQSCLTHCDPMNSSLPGSSVHGIFQARVLEWEASLVAQRLKRLPAMQETWVRSLGREDPLEKEMATHSSRSDEVLAQLCSFLKNFLSHSFQLLGFLQLLAHRLLPPSPKPAMKDHFLLMSHVSKPYVIA